MSTPMFTKAEAVALLTEKLGVTDVEKRLETDKASLLHDIIVAWHTELIFQNLRLISIPPKDRHRPTLQEIKDDVMNGIGGLCYNLNVAAFFLLQALGYKASLASATCTSSVLFPGNHVVVYVCDLHKLGDKYIVEVGFGFPTFRAVNVDFEVESPVFVDSFLEYKYVKHDGKILRMHRKGCLVRESGRKNPVTDFYIGEWRRFYYADLEGTTNLEVFDEQFESVWSKPECSPFHTTLRAIKSPNKKAVMVINNKTLIENDKGELEATEIEGGAEGLVSMVIKHFPSLPETMVRQAVHNFKALS